MRRTTLYTIYAAIVAGLLPSMVWAYPSALNLVPTADILGPYQLRLAYESDGHNQPYDDGNSEYVYTQFGLGGKFEFGLDSYDVKRAGEKYLNAKYLLASERDDTPAVAFGVRNISQVSKTSYYAVGFRTLNRARVHFGIENQSGDNSGILGLDYGLGKGVTFLADWQSGEGRYGTVGLYWQATPAIGVNLYVARNNTSALRDAYDYVGAYAGYTLTLR